ncbi:MAG TPA: hypothetical protein VMM79_05040 [Longimicrobiales bacterium]|nr:hypothetical protein [Longimicrobiales bacterium]
MTRSCGLALAMLCLGAALPAFVTAQGVRGTASTTSRLIEFRPLQADTIDASRLEIDADGRVRLDGRPIACRPATPCIVYRPTERQVASTLSQDVRLTAWGFGVTGLSATAFLRARAHAGDAVWPRADDAFDAMIAYVEWDRSPVRFRVGRQYAMGGLGFSSFDGASVLYRRGRSLSAELYAGRSLARGLSEPRSEALQAFDDFVPDPSVILLGGTVSGSPVPGMDLAGRYQREIFANRAGLASERASAEVSITRIVPIHVVASADYDFAFGRIGKAHVRARVPVGNAFAVEATGRRYLPYFELWTIWGFFDPVGYNEGELLVAWTDGARLGLTAAGSLRRYGETGVNVIGPTLERDTRRVSLNGWWQPLKDWTFNGSFRRETGFGASFGGGDVSVRWDPGPAAIRASVTVFEQIEEFRVGEGSVLGAGIDGTVRITTQVEIDAGLSLYRHTSDREDTADWNQRRAFVSLRLGFGRDPGMRQGGGPR